jgi:GNAT superfamily N-acetyltransferase
LAVFPGSRREETPDVVRHVDLIGHSGVVIYSALSADTVEAAIDAQIDHFRHAGQEFEWKVYQHDQPADLVIRLAARGFDVDEPEAVLVLDLSGYPPSSSRGVRRVERRDELYEVASVKERVYGKGAADLINQLAFEMEHARDYLSVYVAYLDDVPAATAWIRFREHSAFASLWGGATLPGARNRGLYTSLLAARIEEARQRGYPYVTVDAGNMSRPILEKHGFRVLTYATACTWHG